MTFQNLYKSEIKRMINHWNNNNNNKKNKKLVNK